MKKIKASIIGLDTSHSIQFTQRAQAPDCDPQQRVDGLEIISCMRFETPFQDRKGLDERSAQLEKWGVKVYEDFDRTVAGADALLLEINDPILHLEYFKKAAALGKPIFLDKPLADNIENGLEIVRIARESNIRMFSASSLRFIKDLEEVTDRMEGIQCASVFGPLGLAAAGESVVWYGVHTFEMLQRLMGSGAVEVSVVKDGKGVVAVVGYNDGRRGVVELAEGAFVYGGSVRSDSDKAVFIADMTYAYKGLLDRIVAFFNGGPSPVSLDATLEIMNMIDATVKAMKSGKTEKLTAV
ncbi:MAG: Gfo/Idh/MocA family oxidoreductase [Clostridia bacterium]|nr:Gfo/Idh/MocA family oxidoreductase [Clostridia bacterium]